MPADRLSPEDARMLTLESAAVRGHTCKVIVVEGELDVGALRDHMLRRLGRAPRCRQRVDTSGGAPAWVDDETFDIANHVVAAGEPLAGEDELRELVAELMATPLDHDRPLWRIDAARLDPGRTALVWRIHHCLADGMTVMRLGSQLLWEPAGGSGAAPAKRPADAGRRSPASRLLTPVRTVLRLPGALRREALPLPEPSVFDQEITSARAVAFSTAPLEELKAIEHGAGEGITVNDVVLAAVAGALRRWLREHHETAPPMRVQVPVSMHRAGEAAKGAENRDSFIEVDLPLGADDPLERLRLVNAETAERKARHDADTMYAFFNNLERAKPLRGLGSRLSAGARAFTLSVSNVPGPREPVAIAGQGVQELRFIAEPAEHHALRISVVSLSGAVCFSLCTDPTVVTGVDALAEHVDQAVAELRSATG